MQKPLNWSQNCNPVNIIDDKTPSIHIKQCATEIKINSNGQEN